MQTLLIIIALLAALWVLYQVFQAGVVFGENRILEEVYGGTQREYDTNILSPAGEPDPPRGVQEDLNLQEAIRALKAYGANIMPLTGLGERTWWVEDNGIWGLEDSVPQGFYYTDQDLIDLAEKHTTFEAQI